MEAADVRSLSEAILKEKLGARHVADISVKVGADDDGTEFLDIVVSIEGSVLPKATESVAATRVLRHALKDRGEKRFPSVIYVASAEAA